MKILLIQPLASKKKLWGKYSVEGGLIPPIGLLSIAGYLESKGHLVKIIDPLACEYDEKKTSAYLKKEKFELIGISTFTNTVVDTYYSANFCKKILKNVKIVVGGFHATALPLQTMNECKDIDFLIIGEGELTMGELVSFLETGEPKINKIKGLVYRKKNNQLVVNDKRDLIDDINILPFPAYHLLDMSKYIPHPTQYKLLPSFPVIAQRGCPFNCAFCSAHLVHGKKIRKKTVKNLISEISLLINKYKAKGIHFQDSTFTVDRNYIINFCKEVIKQNLEFKWDINTRVDCIDNELLNYMKKAGLWMINFGLESGNQKSLDLLNKKISLKQIEECIKMTRKKGIVTFSTWILGLPGEDEKMVRETIRFAKKISTELALFFLPVPYPGTELVSICRRTGGLREQADWNNYSSVDFDRPVYVNPLLGKNKMQSLLKNAYLSYYFSPKIIWRNIRSIDCWSDFIRYWRGFRALFYGWIT